MVDGSLESGEPRGRSGHCRIAVDDFYCAARFRDVLRYPPLIPSERSQIRRRIMNQLSRQEMGLPDLLGNGKTLKQHRDEVLDRTKKTGFYNGLAKLEFKESDPIT